MREQTPIRYRIYADDSGRYYLYDLIVISGRHHAQLGMDPTYAMKFDRWAIAQRYHELMVQLGYTPHIEQVREVNA